MSTQHNQDDPIRRLMEWQDHRYDPGYFLGGRIHPVLLGRHRNKFGYLLIIFGSAGLLITISAIEIVFYSLIGLLTFLFMSGFSVLQLAAGIKLLRRPVSQSSDVNDEDDEGELVIAEEPTQAADQEEPLLPRRKSRKPYIRHSWH